MNSRTYGVAVVGCGLMGTRWGEEVNHIPRLRLVKMMDRDLSKACTSAAKCRTTATASFDDVLTDPSIDVVVVAVRADQHHRMSMALLEAGKHVLCEKPYSMHLSEIDQAIAFCRARKQKLRIGFMLRFLPGLTDLVARVKAGELGHPLYLRHFLHQGGPDNWNYFQSLIDAAGSPAADCGIHYIDLFHWMTGERINQVYACGLRTELPLDGRPNLCQVLFKTPSGSAGWAEDCWTRVATSRKQMEILGPNAGVEFFWEPDSIRVVTRRAGESTPETATWPPSSKPLSGQMLHFIREIDQDLDTVSHLEDVRHATAVVQAANESMNTAMPVRL